MSIETAEDLVELKNFHNIYSLSSKVALITGGS